MALSSETQNSGYYFFDTDILIDYLRGVKEAEKFLLEAIERDLALVISTVSIVELWSGTETSRRKSDWLAKQKRLEKFLDLFVVYDIGQSIARRAGELRRDYSIPFADAIVAATSLAVGGTFESTPLLVTKNVKHYNPLADDGKMRVIRPY